MYASCLNPRDGPMSHSVSCSIFEKIDPSRVSFFSPCHVGRISQSKTSRQDGDRINAFMKCTLDREDYTSLRFPFILPYAWISRRDSCLVGASCHIPSSGLTYACFHLCIMFKFLKLGPRNFGSLKNLNKRRAKTLKSHSLFQNALLRCLIFLARVLIQTKNNEHLKGFIFGTLNLNH